MPVSSNWEEQIRGHGAEYIPLAAMILAVRTSVAFELPPFKRSPAPVAAEETAEAEAADMIECKLRFAQASKCARRTARAGDVTNGGAWLARRVWDGPRSDYFLFFGARVRRAYT